MRTIVIGIALVSLSISMSFAQCNDSIFYFDDFTGNVDFKSVDRTIIPSNYFGEDIALKLYVLQRSYTYLIKGTASSPGDKVQVEKPVIYNNVKKMSRYYKKLARKGLMSQEEAKAKLDNVLNIGLSIKNQSTKEFENALRQAKKADKVAQVFDRVVME